MKKNTNRFRTEFCDAVNRYDLAPTVRAVCKKHHITVDDLISGSRMHPMPKARAEIWVHMREEGWSYPRIGLVFGVHNATVLTAVRRHHARESLTDSKGSR
jgi:chromosomal replication initiation ATPase DnaA